MCVCKRGVKFICTTRRMIVSKFKGEKLIVDSTTVQCICANVRSIISEIHLCRLNEPDLEGIYSSVYRLCWQGIEQYPEERCLYRAASRLEEAVRNARTILAYSHTTDETLGSNFKVETKKIDDGCDSQLLRLYRIAMQRMPSWAEAWSNLASFSLEKKEYAETQEYLLNAIRDGDTWEEVEFCLHKYLQSFSLWGIAGTGVTGYGVQDDTPVLWAWEAIKRDWQLLTVSVEKSRHLESAQVSYEYRKATYAIARTKYAVSVLPEYVSNEHLSRVTYWTLCQLIWRDIEEPYAPDTVAEKIALAVVSKQGAILQQLNFDYLLQQFSLDIDMSDDVLEAEQQLLWIENYTFQTMQFARYIVSGDFDQAVFILQQQIQHTGEKARKQYQRFQATWGDDSTSRKLARMVNIHLDRIADQEAKDAWNNLQFASIQQMTYLVFAIRSFPQKAFVTDTVRRVVAVQPWLGRFLSSHETLHYWLDEVLLLDTFIEDKRVQEIDAWLAYVKSASGSYSWEQVNETMDTVANALETWLRNPGYRQLWPEPAWALGKHVWQWLDQDSKTFIEESERQYRHYVLSSESYVHDYAGIFLGYQKALEITLSRVLVAPYGEVKKKNIRFYELQTRVEREVDDWLSADMEIWRRILAERLETIRQLRNASIHRDVLERTSFMHLRHLIMGMRYRGRRTVNIFWLAYAIERALNQEKA